LGKQAPKTLVHMAVQERWATCVQKFHTCLKADADTDHVLVRMLLKLKLQRVKQGLRKVAYSYENGNEFQCELRNRFELLALPSEDGADGEEKEGTTRADHEWERIKEAISQAAKITLTRKPRIQKKAWVKLDTFALVEQKRHCARGSEKLRLIY
jgi:uncharacterized protein YrzB (UPF0473 family)